jgi:hypothetical protein
MSRASDSHKRSMRGRFFGPSVRKEKVQVEQGGGRHKRRVEVEIDVPDRIIAHLTMECGGNIHDHHVGAVACGSFEKESQGANPHLEAYDNRADFAAKNLADLETGSIFLSVYRAIDESILRTRNNCICYEFKESKLYQPTTHSGQM